MVLVHIGAMSEFGACRSLYQSQHRLESRQDENRNHWSPGPVEPASSQPTGEQKHQGVRGDSQKVRARQGGSDADRGKRHRLHHLGQSVRQLGTDRRKHTEQQHRQREAVATPRKEQTAAPPSSIRGRLAVQTRSSTRGTSKPPRGARRPAGKCSSGRAELPRPERSRNRRSLSGNRDRLPLSHALTLRDWIRPSGPKHLAERAESPVGTEYNAARQKANSDSVVPITSTGRSAKHAYGRQNA